MSDLEEAGMSEDRARYLYLKGRLLNVEPDYSIQAEESLSKAVKLNPGMFMYFVFYHLSFTTS